MWRIFKFFKRDKLNTLKEEHDNALNIAANKEQEIINTVIDKYIDEEERQQLVSDAKRFGYSSKTLSRIESVFSNFNQDTLTYNVAEDIIDARNHVRDHKKESFLSKISNVIPEDEIIDENDDSN
jgi:hypothetical protein